MNPLQLLTSSARNSGSNLSGSQKCNFVWKRSRSESALRSRVDRTTEVDILNNSITSLLGISKENSALNRVGESRALDENLSAHAGVDTGKKNAVPVVVDDVDGSEADEGLAAADVLPVVVRVGDVKLALVL